MTVAIISAAAIVVSVLNGYFSWWPSIKFRQQRIVFLGLLPRHLSHRRHERIRRLRFAPNQVEFLVGVLF